MPKGRKKPTLDQAREWVRHDVQIWERRNVRFEREQRAYYLTRPYEPKPGEELVIPNDPAFITEKAARSLARLPHRLEIPAKDPSNLERPQKIENLLRTIWEQWKRQHGAGLHGPLMYEMSKYLIQRGWVCSRILLNDDPDSNQPVKHTIWDPATVYPYEVDGEVVRVTHKYQAKISDLLEDDDLPKSETIFALIDTRNANANVYSQYVKHAKIWYHMVWTDYGMGAGGDPNGWLKPPTQIDYNPWVINFAIGSPWRATQYDQQEYIEHIGESFFTSMLGMYKQQTKMMTMLATIIATMANPPTALFLDDGGKVLANDVKMKPGSRMVFPKGKIEQFRLGAGLSDITAYWQMLQDRQNKSSFSSVTFGDHVGIESGYMGESLKAGNADVMFPFIECLTQHLEQCYEKTLDVIGKFWPSQMRALVPRGVNRPAQWATLTARDIMDEDPYVKVSFRTATLQERMQMSNMVASLTREHLIDLHTGRGSDFLDLDDPYLIEQRVQSDLIKMDPKMIQAMIPIALLFTGQELEQKLYGQIHGGEIMQLLQPHMQPQPGMPQQGPSQPQGGPQMPQPSQPMGQPSMPAPGPAGMPGEVMPPVMAQGQQPMSPDEQDIMNIMQMMQQAQGGSGQGGVPPLPPGSGY